MIQSKILIALLCATGLATAVSVEARDFHRQGSYQGSRGGSGSFQQQIHRERGSMQRDIQWQGQNGSGNAQLQRCWDRQTGMASGNRSATRADGSTASRSWTSTREADGGRSVSGTRTGFGGQTSSYAGTRQRNGEGGISQSGTVTRANGNTATVQSTATRTANGWNRSGTGTTAAGQTYGRDVSVTHEDHSATRTVTVTPPTEDARSRTSMITFDQ